MAIKDKLSEEFSTGIKEIESNLSLLNFQLYSVEKIGLSQFVRYKRKDTIVKFLFGPVEWQVELIVNTPKRKFEFKDILQIPDVARWVRNNRYYDNGNRNIKNELLWLIELLKISLPFIE